MIGAETSCFGGQLYYDVLTQEDLDAIGSCTTLETNLWIFANITNITIPATLQTIKEQLYIRSSRVETFQAPGLRTVGLGIGSGSLQTRDCPLLASASFPQLTTVGGDFELTDSSTVHPSYLFPRLEQVNHDFIVVGNFDKLSFPNLKIVGGGVNIQSSSPSFRCPFPEIRTNGVIQGNGFICSGNIENPSWKMTGANKSADFGIVPADTSTSVMSSK